MKGLTILFAFCILFSLSGCSKEEPATSAKPTVQPIPKEAPMTKAVDEVKQVAKQVEEKVEQVAKQVEEKAVATVEQAKAALVTGQLVYTKACLACHKLGISGAPKTGDKKAWSSLIAGGTDNLVKNAINGVGRMAPKGGSSSLTDDEVKAAVEYMVEQSR